jgi:hydrogenase maturation protein HypF
MERVGAENNLIRKRLLLKGIVQGVGFRPFLFGKAIEHQITGFAENTMNSLHIEAEGKREKVCRFVADILTRPPSRAEILSSEELDVAPVASVVFEILESNSSGSAGLAIAPDAAICPECIQEIFDPSNRRFGYPFNSCIHCGPRYSILKTPPFDRSTTSMSDFTMCEICQTEYSSPGSRRFHSQTNSCPGCGPRIRLTDNGGREIESGDPLILAVDYLKAGKVVAVKGIGGFHLAVDAENEEAVRLLRQRKRRPRKPLAIMSAEISDILRYAEMSDAERAALTSPAAPIVLLKKRTENTIASGIAPGLNTLGVLLAYTPLHHLLLRDNFLAVVMTSANRSGEPLLYQDEDAIVQLADICDFFLLHDRDIIKRCDDSIVRFAGATPILLRRARGFVPRPIILERSISSIIAYGAHEKNTVTVTAKNLALTSRYIGDLDRLKTLDAMEEACGELQQSLGLIPEVAACDLHPDYASTKIAEERRHVRLHRQQHHHAHALSCMAENHLLDREVLSVVFDGAGLGIDGNIWGSEFLAVRTSSVQRLAHMRYVRMPGGEAAVREPYRMAVSYLYSLYGNDALEMAREFFPDIHPGKIALLVDIIRNEEYAPLTCGMGRLFDAVAALLGLCSMATYESEGPANLESIAAEGISEAYQFQIDFDDVSLINPAPVLIEIVHDFSAGITTQVISAKFHNAIGKMILRVCEFIRNSQRLSTIALSGGVFQNRYLLQSTLTLLTSSAFEVVTHKYLPPNDECISLGQAIGAHERERCALQFLPE